MIATWMAYTTLVTACAAAAAWGVEQLMAARGRARRTPWFVALVASAVIPVLVAIRPAAVRTESALEGPMMAATSVLVAAAGEGWSVDRWLLLGWGMGSAALLAAFGWSFVQLWRIARVARAITMEGEVVALTPNTGPGARCFGTPRIVVPARLASLDAAQRALLIAHEREHLRAGDPQVLLASLVALALTPWNPALWVIARRLRTSIELDCDARVLAAGAEVRTYGELLLTVAARRPPRLATYLAFAAAPSSLERRIRAMTSRQSLGIPRTLCAGAVVVAAVVTACDTRRPPPLAPVATYTVDEEGGVRKTATTGAAADSLRKKIAGEVRALATGEVRVRMPAPGLTGTDRDPLVMVYDARGSLVLSGRLAARGANGLPSVDSLPFPREAIESVEVVKSGALLPPDAKGGLIRVTLKESASLPAKQRQPAMLRRRSAQSGDSLAATSLLLRSHEAPPGDTSGRGAIEALPAKAPSSAPGPMLIVLDSQGREIWRRIAPAGETLRGSLPFSDDAIDRVEVRKRRLSQWPEGEIVITLKEGAKLGRER